MPVRTSRRCSPSRGVVAAVQRKRHLGEGEEAFAVADDDALFELDGVRFAIAICAESRIDRPFAHARARRCRARVLLAAPRASTSGEPPRRSGSRLGLVVRRRASATRSATRATYGLWIAIATQAGSTVDEDFPGLAALVDPTGEVVAQLPDWRPGTLVVDVLP